MSDKGFVLDQPWQIEAWRLLSYRSRLKLEIKGIRFRDGSTYAHIKREFGLKGNRERVLAQYEEMLRNRGLLQ